MSRDDDEEAVKKESVCVTLQRSRHRAVKMRLLERSKKYRNQNKKDGRMEKGLYS